VFQNLLNRADTRYEVPHDAPHAVLYFYLRMESIIVETFNEWEYGEKIFLQRLEEQCAKVDTRIPSAKGWDYFSAVTHLHAFTEYDTYQDIMKKLVAQQILANFQKFMYEVVATIFILFVLLVLSSVLIVFYRRRVKYLNASELAHGEADGNVICINGEEKEKTRYNLSKIKKRRRCSMRLISNFIAEVYTHVLAQIRNFKCPKLPRISVRKGDNRKRRINSRYINNSDESDSENSNEDEDDDEDNEMCSESDYKDDDGYDSNYDEDEKLID